MIRNWRESRESVLSSYLAQWTKSLRIVADRIALEVATAARSGELTVLWEQSDLQPDFSRGVVQFRVSPATFDEFFNSPTGYRGMFFQSAYLGTCTNAAIIIGVADSLRRVLPSTVVARVVLPGFVPAGQVDMEKARFLESLEPWLAKIWMCTVPITCSGERRPVPLGVGHEHIEVGHERSWVAICREPEDCFLEVKGAFVASFGLFQPKSISERGSRLESYGEA